MFKEERERIDSLRKIYEPLNTAIEDAESLASDLTSALEELKDNLTNLSYERDSLREFIDKEEMSLSELIIQTKFIERNELKGN
jgi:chromosome segregation ATPase